MTAYYNEIDLYCADWLRNLIREELIPDGHVDTRSIGDVRPTDLEGFAQCHFFAGLGGWAGALRLAGWPDHRPVWTGSCPCQPFSLAGRQGGFADERHLWPWWYHLIAQRRPPVILGEQVASAAEWLRLVRGDLETLDYAVGAIPCEAASAGADHLRDRFWFVGDDPSERRREGWAEHAVRSGWPAAAGNGRLEHAPLIPQREQNHEGHAEPDGRQARTISCGASDHGIILADADGTAIRIEPGWGSGPRGAGAREHRDDSEIDVAGAHEPCQGEGWQQRSGQQRGLGGDPETLSWVIGADGKARRVKSGIRLLAHGVPARVAKLRALGNAIDLRPAAAFIKAVM